MRRLNIRKRSRLFGACLGAFFTESLVSYNEALRSPAMAGWGVKATNKGYVPAWPHFFYMYRMHHLILLANMLRAFWFLSPEGIVHLPTDH